MIPEYPNLLTVAIPTYNRAAYLKRNLNALKQMLQQTPLPVEVIVCDNCSSDNTKVVVEEFVEEGLPIRYFTSPKNLGPDLNILKAYQEANGEYVLCLGDDDLLIDAALSKIVEVLSRHKPGVLFLKSFSFVDDPELEKRKSLLSGYKLFQNSDEFLQNVGYFITFISANVIAKRYFNPNLILPLSGTNLLQVGFILPAILGAEYNIIIEDALVAVQADNSGGYNLFKVFGVNLPKIMDDIPSMSLNAKWSKEIKKLLVVDFFPRWLKTIRSREPALWIEQETLVEFDNIYKDVPYYFITKKLFNQSSRFHEALLAFIFLFHKVKRKIKFISKPTYRFAS